MEQVTIVLKNEVGLHSRPAALFQQEVSKYKSDIKLIKNNKSYNARSILSILSMGAGKGDEITVTADGDDEADAIGAITNLLESFKD